MTGTAVKNVAAVMPGPAASAGNGVKSAAAGELDFQSVWNNQMGKNTQNAADAQKPVQKPASGTQKQEQPAENSDVARTEGTQDAGEKLEQPTDGSQQPAKTGKEAMEGSGRAEGEHNAKELSPEELQAAMEALGAAAMELMREIADAFGISMEELQAALKELGMEPMELLQPAGLAEAVLKLGGAQDSLALLTDETLCDNYKALMERMTGLMDEAAEGLKADPEELRALMAEKPVTAEGQENALVEAVPGKEAVEERVPERTALEGAVYVERDSGRDTENRAEEITKAPDFAAEDSLRPEAGRPEGTGDKKDGEKQPERDAEGGQPGNLFAQEFKPLQPEAGVQQAQNVSQGSPWDADTQDIMRQIMDYMKLQLNADTTNLELHLHPESLGTLHIQVEAKAGVITASFIAQNEAVKAALESQIVQLKESFEEQGVKVEAIEVMVQSHAFERNLEQGRGQGQEGGEPSRKARVRRINLNDLSDMDDMEEEDALAADMLAAGGSTVDYTA